MPKGSAIIASLRRSRAMCARSSLACTLVLLQASSTGLRSAAHISIIERAMSTL